VFGHQVTLAQSQWTGSSGGEEVRLVEEVVAADPRTLVIRWREPYAEAAIPSIRPWAPHILRSALEEGNQQAFESHPYWMGEYIGVGPYRLARWEPGSFIEGLAFDGFALGRPNISRVVLNWSQDPNATISRMLSGHGDIAVDDALQFQEATTLQQQWFTSNEGAIILSPTRLRYVQVQARPEYVNPKSLLDVRVRRALLHAVDRQTLADIMLEGKGMVAETFVPPTLSFYPVVDAAVAKYPYDPRRSDQLMAEAGFPKAGDGYYTSASEGRFSLQVRGIAEGQEGRETTTIADYLRRAGADPSLDLVPSTQRQQSAELRSTFPALTANNATVYRDLTLNKNITSAIASPANRWSGGNRTGYSSPEYDRLFETWTRTLDAEARNQAVVQLLKVANDDLPSLPMYFNFDVVAHVSALVGPSPVAPDSTYYAKIHEWRWR
jgi:peptide/nickel transport system substrate-binding protein